MAEPLRFSKMHGAGNDFVVLDLRDGTPPPDAALCRALAIIVTQGWKSACMGWRLGRRWTPDQVRGDEIGLEWRCLRAL